MNENRTATSIVLASAAVSSFTAAWVDVIESIDLNDDIACEHSQHHTRHIDEPAKYLIRILYTCTCGPTYTYAMCEYGWNWLGSGDGLVSCQDCGETWPRDDVLKIVQTLR